MVSVSSASEATVKTTFKNHDVISIDRKEVEPETRVTLIEILAVAQDNPVRAGHYLNVVMITP